MTIPTRDPSGQAQKPRLRIVTTQENTPQHTWAVAAAVMRRTDMKTLDKMALLTLLHFANVELGWKAWPSEKRIFEHMGCDQKAGRKALHRLEQSGIIRIERQQTQNAPNAYYVDPQAAMRVHPKAEHPKADAAVHPDADAPVDPKTDAPEHPKADHYHSTYNRGSEQTTQNRSMSMSKSLARGRAEREILSRRKGPLISLPEARIIAAKIPEELIGKLSLVTDEQREFGQGYFRRRMVKHIQFRGELDWTQICWHALYRTLLGQYMPGWDDIRDPAAYVASVADYPSHLADTPPYSEAALEQMIIDHNAELDRRASRDA